MRTPETPSPHQRRSLNLHFIQFTEAAFSAFDVFAGPLEKTRTHILQVDIVWEPRGKGPGDRFTVQSAVLRTNAEMDSINPYTRRELDDLVGKERKRVQVEGGKPQGDGSVYGRVVVRAKWAGTMGEVDIQSQYVGTVLSAHTATKEKRDAA